MPSLLMDRLRCAQGLVLCRSSRYTTSWSSFGTSAVEIQRRNDRRAVRRMVVERLSSERKLVGRSGVAMLLWLFGVGGGPAPQFQPWST